MNRDDFFGFIRGLGAIDAGAARADDGPPGLPFAVSLAARLSDAVIEEIDREPTYTYFHHYRAVNAFLDGLTLRAGFWLQGQGARYVAVAASQSAPGSPYEGRYSHKKAAVLAGLGALGRSNLFLHRDWGPRVRLATLFTDWPGFTGLPGREEPEGPPLQPEAAGYLEPGPTPGLLSPLCASCTACADACPAGAIGRGGAGPVFYPEKCSAWMKKAYHHIGRGAVCGICVRVCPGGRGRTALNFFP